MPVSASQVGACLQAGMDELAGLGIDEQVLLLWCQQHPDGPDWHVPDAVYLAWRQSQPDPQALPSLNVWVNAARGAVMIEVVHGDARRRTETFTEGGAQTNIAAAANRYVQLAAQVLAATFQEPGGGPSAPGCAGTSAARSIPAVPGRPAV